MGSPHQPPLFASERRAGAPVSGAAPAAPARQPGILAASCPTAHRLGLQPACLSPARLPAEEEAPAAAGSAQDHVRGCCWGEAGTGTWHWSQLSLVWGSQMLPLRRHFLASLPPHLPAKDEPTSKVPQLLSPPPAFSPAGIPPLSPGN